ncbi:MAG: hypothetical protein A2V57_04545 [Candidatus Aminicenantes bacterium RBG_19FT_COMBO_65_30]|nr:MAG: hypothetical protein A2V57_04545 [Candidatus Aminicenantes bacterium RBG_19FT_COMBO_65_30]
MKFSRTDWKYIVDTLMFLCMLGIVLIGLLMGFVIPEGRLGPGQSKYFLGLHRHQWGDVHLYLSLAFTAVVVVHIVLAWSWVKGKAKGLFGRFWKGAMALSVVAVVLVPAVFWLAASKNDPAYAEFGEGQGQQGRRVVESGRPALEPLDQAASTASVGAPAAAREPGVAAAEADVHGDKTVAGRQEAGTAEAVITGKMTLREVERATGIPAKDIVARLGLPSDVSLDETLGRLRQAYAFELQTLRDAVAKLLEEKRPPLPR